MRTRLKWIVPVLIAAACGSLTWAMTAGAGAATTVPYCKAGQKTTTAHPCKKPPVCKAGQRSTTTHPCTKPVATTPSHTSTGSSSGGTTTTTHTASGGSGGSASNGCAPGESIPQGAGAGDADDDNNGGVDDGDGCL